MDPDQEKFLDAEDPLSLRVDDEEEERDGEEDEEEDGKIFNAWMLRCRPGDRQQKPKKEEAEEEEPQTEEPGSRSGAESPMKMRTDRRPSLPCPVRRHRETHLNAPPMT